MTQRHPESRHRTPEIALLLAVVLLCPGVARGQDQHQTDARIQATLEERERLDETVWADEVEAQAHEAVFVDLWDRLRASDAPLGLLAGFPFASRLSIGCAKAEDKLDLGIRRTSWGDDPCETYSPAAWRRFVESFEARGFELPETEWHHDQFFPSDDGPARSLVSFKLFATSVDPRVRYFVSGRLAITWKPGATPQVDSIRVRDLEVLERPESGLFREVLTIDEEQGHPFMVYDLDGDGRSELVFPASNAVYRNLGQGRFSRQTLLQQPRDFWSTAILADFDRDSNVDLLAPGKDGALYLYRGNGSLSFASPPEEMARLDLVFPLNMTAGDVDGDGDLDLWLTQRSRVSQTSVFPTPYYDANNSDMSYLLLNDNAKRFVDATSQAGLGDKRNRWTFASSLVDFDGDGDQDLINVADFAGLDLYRNNGEGRFEDITASLRGSRHLFGMGLALADFDGDAKLDFYATGMSSTTARRLEQMGLRRDDRPEATDMRMAMAWGNRMYYSNGSGFEESTAGGSAVARQGWAWGTSAFDFDLDGDQDLYVANGYRSGESAEDYCTRWWTHDIYVDEPPEVLHDLFEVTFAKYKAQEISWNGFEHNGLLMNLGAQRFVNVAFLFDLAFAYDARAVVTDDLNLDGRPDLIVSQETKTGSTKLHTVHVYLNRLATGGSWVGAQLPEAGGGFTPVGAKVSVVTPSGTQTRWLTTGDATFAQRATTQAHFGLGDETEIDRILVAWPNGEEQRLEQPAPGRYHLIRPQSP